MSIYVYNEYDWMMIMNDEEVRILKVAVIACFRILPQAFAQTDWEKLWKTSIRAVGLRLRFKPQTSWVWCRSDNHAIMTFCPEDEVVHTWGGGSMKWNCSKSWTPRDLRSRTVLARLVRCISGTVVTNSSSLYCRSVYNLKYTKFTNNH